MPYFPNSPEARLGRSDSKNPATTCKGINLNGKPCRRTIGRNSPAASPGGSGVLAILHHVGGSNDDAAAYYCYQHKDQAPTGSTLTDTVKMDLKNRTSIDTLMDRLGVLTVEDETPTKPKKKQSTPGSRPVKRNTLPQQWQNVPGPFLSVADGSTPAMGSTSLSRPRPPPQPQFVKPRNRSFILSCFCCGSGDGERPPLAPRPCPMAQRPVPTAVPPGSASLPQRPSQTAILNSWIPSSVTTAIHAKLLTELSKPLTKQDTDTGYIYMFWETPISTPHPTPELARSMLSSAWNNRAQLLQDTRQTRDGLLQDPWAAARSLGAGVRRPSDAMRVASQTDKLEIKIGRADNVQKRMDQWTRQCGKNITLLRYYPYTSSSSTLPGASPRGSKGVAKPEPGQTPAGPNHPGPVPNCARVERLIHVELSEQRTKKNCAACGREHREWFEIEASKEGVQRVDEIIRRWTRWGEQKAMEDGRYTH